MFNRLFHGFIFFRCKAISCKCSEFHLLFDNSVALDALQYDPPGDGKKWSVFLEVDIGGDRSKSIN